MILQCHECLMRMALPVSCVIAVTQRMPESEPGETVTYAAAYTNRCDWTAHRYAESTVIVSTGDGG